jgi:hypothetical protein
VAVVITEEYRRSTSSIPLSRSTPYNGTVHQLFIDFKKAYYSFRRDALWRILHKFSSGRKLTQLKYTFKWNLQGFVVLQVRKMYSVAIWVVICNLDPNIPGGRMGCIGSWSLLIVLLSSMETKSHKDQHWRSIRHSWGRRKVRVNSFPATRMQDKA